MDSAGTDRHRLSLEGRKQCRVSGVLQVISFDEKTILLETCDGILTIKGDGLHVGRLDLERGEADMEGRTDSFAYSEKTSLAKKGEGLLTRLFS